MVRFAKYLNMLSNFSYFDVNFSMSLMLASYIYNLKRLGETGKLGRVIVWIGIKRLVLKFSYELNVLDECFCQKVVWFIVFMICVMFCVSFILFDHVV